MHKIFRACMHALKSSKIAFPKTIGFANGLSVVNFTIKLFFLLPKKVARAFSR